MAKRSPTTADVPQESVDETLPPVAVVEEAATPVKPLSALEALQARYRDPRPERGDEYLPLRWHNPTCENFEIVSPMGVLTWPDGSALLIPRADISQVFHFLSNLRPKDNLSIHPLS